VLTTPSPGAAISTVDLPKFEKDERLPDSFNAATDTRFGDVKDAGYSGFWSLSLP
jgi:hypothetical protein